MDETMCGVKRGDCPCHTCQRAEEDTEVPCCVRRQMVCGRACSAYIPERSRGITAGGVAAIFICALVAVLLLTMQASSAETGLSVGEQVYQAVFVTEDW